VGALGLLAACNEEVGRIATARRQYLDTARRATAVGDARGAFAQERATALAAQVPKLTVRATLAAGETLRCDGENSEPFEIDPGTHEIVLAAAAGVRWRGEVTLARGEQKTIDAAASQPRPESPASSGPGPRSALPADSAANRSVQRTLGWIGVGVGGAGIAVGAVVGGVVLARQSALEEDDQGCPDACTDAGAVDDYNRLRIVSGAAFIGGAVVAAAGAVLLITAPRPAPSVAVGVRASHRGTALGFSGAF